jgi:hypothetical protein
MSQVLPDIERGFTWTQEYRHQCEVRQVIKWRKEDRNHALDYLEAVRKKRGASAGDQLERDVKDQWTKGNRGNDGDWR